MRALTLAPLVLLASAAFGAYTYYYPDDTLTSINTSNWTQNGSVTATSGGLTATSANGGSLISKVAVPDGTLDYEVKVTLTLTASGGTYVSYLRASTNAMTGPAAQGAYYSIELQNPTFSGNTCSATLALNKRASNVVTLLGSTTVACKNGMTIRSIYSTYNTGTVLPPILIYVNDILSLQVLDTTLSTGQPGIGAFGMPAGNSIARVDLGPRDRIAPGAISAQSVGSSVFPTRVDLQWPGVVDDANGIGMLGYRLNDTITDPDLFPISEFSDPTLTASRSYTYVIEAVDQHGNGGGSATISVTTPPAGGIDPRRVGVRPTGSYWGAEGEQIDTLSGNLNFTIPLFKAMGRGGWGETFALIYNSQFWRKDSGGTWKMAHDLGYGLGWRLQAGSLTPYYQQDWTFDHYLFIDSTGTEYRLNINTNGVWTSSEGIYVSYDTTVSPSRLYFPDGSFWIMGVTSGGTEQDAGTMYPSVMEDTNGNQILIRYNTGLNSPFTNSSARISEIEDVRAVYNSTTGTYQSYTFTYNTDAIPHLTQINNVIGNGIESYTLSYLENQSLSSPFSPTVAFGTATLLQTLAVTNLSYGHSFQYDASGSGELTSVTFPLGGKIRWAYRGFTYNGSRTLREVQYRYLTMTSGGTESSAYTFTRNDTADASLSLHSGVTLDDPSGIGEKSWTFSTSGSAWQLGLVTRFEDRPSSAQASSPLKRQDFTWVQDSTGNPYIGTVLTTLDPTGANMQTQTTQTLDTHGNVTQTNIFDYGNLTTAARTYNYTPLTDSNYTSRYIFNRLVSSAVTDNGSQNVTLLTNTYDNQTLANITTLNEHDSNYGTSFAYRGNLTVVAPLGGPNKTTQYDITGAATSVTDGLGHSLAITSSSTNNYAVPSAITPNSNTNLQTSAAYTQWLTPSSVTQPNSSTASTTYDAFGRPQSSTSIYGAVTNYTYSQNGALPMVITATTNSHWTQTTLDGFGRTTQVVRGYNNGSTPVTVGTANTVFASFSCAPLGATQKASRPYAPGGTQYWTTYSYDGLGRTASVVLPDGASTQTYAFAGNATTTTDPAGKWKKHTTNAMGDLVQVNEPNPAGGADYVTTYTYDVIDHLTQVSMTRGTTTQTRTFNYGNPPGVHLLSETHRESGTRTYTYNTDGTLATRTDAKGQKTAYTYDTYQRVTMVQRYPNGTTEDTCQRLTLTYDASNNGNSTNPQGRLTNVQVGTSCTEGTSVEYGYTPAGLVSAKISGPAARYTYTNEGRISGYQSPEVSVITHNPFDYSMTFDLMGRPITMADNQNPTTWVQSVTYGPSDEVTQINRLGTNGYANETRQYNSLGQLTRITMPNMEDQEYVYSATQNNGRITQSINHLTNETITYGYDSLNRLSAATGSGWSETFTYDGFGNLTDKNATGSATPLHVTVDPATNRLSGSNYSYDANGNLTGITGQFTATYNVENQIQSYSPSSGGTETYFYDEQNHRFWTNQANGNILMTFWGPHGERYHTGNPTTGALILQNTYFGTQLIWNTQYYPSGSVASSQAIAMDRLGSVRGFGTQTTSFYPYGEEYTTTTQDREKFATYLRDNFSGLDYAWNRFYSSTLGRFMTPDPYRNSGGPDDPGSWNRYAYASGDPVNRHDPRGLEDCLDCVDDGGGFGGDGGIGGGQGGCDPSLDSSCSVAGPDGLPCGFIYGTACGFGPPMAPPLPPPKSQSSPQQPVCFAQLKYRGVEKFGKNQSVFTHSFWWVQSDTGDYILSSGPAPNEADPFLHAWATHGDYSPTSDDNKDQKLWWSSIVSSGVCSQVDGMVGATESFPEHTFIYDYSSVVGPNSNSFAHYLAEIGIFSPIAPPGSVGWDFPIILPPNRIPPIARPIGPRYRHRL